MSIFNLHSNVLADYRDYVRSFFTVADDRAREFIDRELVEQARLWPEALLHECEIMNVKLNFKLTL